MIGTINPGRLNPRQIELFQASGEKVILVEREALRLDGWDRDGYDIATAEDVSGFHRAVRMLAHVSGLPESATADLQLIASEAASNAVKHGGANEDGRAGRALCEVNVRERRFRIGVLDHGEGIPEADLFDALLTEFWSTKDSLGQGWTVMRKLATTIWLATDAQGTVLVLEYEW